LPLRPLQNPILQSFAKGSEDRWWYRLDAGR
jgi:hypothetical protein